MRAQCKCSTVCLPLCKALQASAYDNHFRLVTISSENYLHNQIRFEQRTTIVCLSTLRQQQ
jgi:hypothetical protein